MSDFPRFMGGWMGVLLAFTAVVSAQNGEVLIAFGLAFLATVAGGVALGSVYLDGRNVGRGRSWRSRTTRRFASIIRLQVRGCGCVYSDGLGNQAPGKEWAEYDTVWIREMHGGRIKFRKAKTGLRRCHSCGKHYNDTMKKGARRRGRFGDAVTLRECWPEDEPDVRAELDERVVDQEVADA